MVEDKPTSVELELRASIFRRSGLLDCWDQIQTRAREILEEGKGEVVDSTEQITLSAPSAPATHRQNGTEARESAARRSPPGKRS